MHEIIKYFPRLSENKVKQFSSLKAIYEDWNAKINVISRKDFDRFYTNHVLHALAIAKFIDFKPNSKILDVGTGGGFPGIPLAIFFEQCDFTLVDSIHKKIKVVNAVKDELGLKNVTAINSRAEQLHQQFDFVVSRAVTQLDNFLPWMKKKIKASSFNDLPNGYIFLKGGDLTEEFKSQKGKYTEHLISEFFEDPFFETKKIVYLKHRR